MSRETDESRTEDLARTRVEPSGGSLASGLVSAAEQLSVGEQLGRFVVLSKLGEGGMAFVYSAYDAELDRKVAIKILRSDAHSARASQGQARLLREAQAMARLSHPNIVQVYEVGKLGRDVFIAMEFIQGQTLRAWLKARRRSWREVVHVFLQAGEGLAAAHAVGVVHRDFKPDMGLRSQVLENTRASRLRRGCVPILYQAKKPVKDMREALLGFLAFLAIPGWCDAMGAHDPQVFIRWVDAGRPGPARRPRAPRVAHPAARGATLEGGSTVNRLTP